MDAQGSIELRSAVHDTNQSVDVCAYGFGLTELCIDSWNLPSPKLVIVFIRNVCFA